VQGQTGGGTPRRARMVKAAPRPSRALSEGRRARTIQLGHGLPTVDKMWEEIQKMTNVLMGRDEIEEEFGILALMEIADAYYARGCEMTMLIQHGEREGTVMKGSDYTRFRTGELRTFTDMAKRAADLGSRRLTMARLLQDQELNGRESV